MGQSRIYEFHFRVQQMTRNLIYIKSLTKNNELPPELSTGKEQ